MADCYAGHFFQGFLDVAAHKLQVMPLIFSVVMQFTFFPFSLVGDGRRGQSTLSWQFAAVRPAAGDMPARPNPRSTPRPSRLGRCNQVCRPPVAEKPDRCGEYDGRPDHAEQTAAPLPMTQPAQRISHEGEHCKQRQQPADEQALVPDSESPARWRRRSWRGPENKRRSPSRK